jgi:hypothetical protein
MGRDWVPAVVSNEAGRGVVLVILDGDVEGMPTPRNFRELAPGMVSGNVVRSVDAFGAYRGDRAVDVFWEGQQSSWWRISDGTRCSVQEHGGALTLVVAARLDHMPPPRPSRAEDWGYTGKT